MTLPTPVALRKEGSEIELPGFTLALPVLQPSSVVPEDVIESVGAGRKGCLIPQRRLSPLLE